MSESPWPTVLDDLPQPGKKSLEQMAEELRELQEYEEELRQKVYGGDDD